MFARTVSKSTVVTARTRPQKVRSSGGWFEFRDPGLRIFSMVHKSGVVIVAISVVLELISTVMGCGMFWRKRF